MVLRLRRLPIFNISLISLRGLMLKYLVLLYLFESVKVETIDSLDVASS
jgi:hypothetical protein